MSRQSQLLHPSPMHALGGGPRLPGAGGGPPSFNFPFPFAPSPHEAAALRHWDPSSLRLMNPAVVANAAQLFGAQSHFGGGVGRPNPGALDPSTAAFLLDPRYRSMLPPFGNPSTQSLIPPSPSNNSSSSSSSNNPSNTHNHAHIHSHSHTHLHLGNNNESSSSNNANGSTMAPPPPSLHQFPNPLSSTLEY